jgi:hypothetical protein
MQISASAAILGIASNEYVAVKRTVGRSRPVSDDLKEFVPK